jgi:hypothetical protein
MFSSWQGWLVLAAFFPLLVLGIFLFPPGAQLNACVAVLSALLGRVCWLGRAATLAVG